jgi:hypothetical protein
MRIDYLNSGFVEEVTILKLTKPGIALKLRNLELHLNSWNLIIYELSKGERSYLSNEAIFHFFRFT